MSGRFLLDASSIVYALKLRNLKIIYENYVQWLTVYEVVNALWKEALLVGSISVQEASSIIELFTEIMKFVEFLSPHPYEGEIFDMASRLRVTVYDASYIVLAREKGLSLVTEDKRLRSKAEEMVKVFSLSELL